MFLKQPLAHAIKARRSSGSKLCVMAFAGDARFTSQLIADVNKIFASELGAKTKLLKIMDAFWAADIPYKTKLLVEEVLVHPKNRNGDGLNPWDAHSLFSKIAVTGGDKTAVQDRATAMEMPPTGHNRAFQIGFNNALIQSSNGLLAPLTGKERVASLACSHTTAIFRAAKHGCATPVKSLQDANGCINWVSVCAKDDVLLDLIQNGWTWTIIPYQAEVIFEWLPALFQEALNSDQTVMTEAGELQTMTMMSDTIEKNPTMTKTDVINRAKGSMPKCHEYLGTLYDFVKQFSGGPGAPLIRFLQGFCKEYGGNRVIGDTFFAAVTTATFATSCNTFAHLRAGCIAANLVCPQHKIQDGVARLLTKTDVQAIPLKGKVLHATAVECHLAEAWSELEGYVAEGKLTLSVRNRLHGLFSARLVLFLAKKGKDSIEAKTYASMSEIKQKFQDELSVEVGSHGARMLADKGSEQEAPAANTHVSLGDASDPMFIAKQHGFNVGNMYTVKDETGEAGKIFKLVAFHSLGATLQLQTVHGHINEELKVPYNSLKKKLSLHKSKLQTTLDALEVERFMPHNHDGIERDSHRALIYGAMMDLVKTSTDIDCDFVIPGGEVHAKRGIVQGALQLVAITELSRITSKSSTSRFIVTVQGCDGFYLDPPMKVTDNNPEVWKEKGNLFVASWWCQASDDRKICNLTLTSVSKDGYTVPMLTNSKAVKKHDKLVWYDAAAAQAKKKAKT